MVGFAIFPRVLQSISSDLAKYFLGFAKYFKADLLEIVTEIAAIIDLPKLSSALEMMDFQGQIMSG